MNTSEWPTVHLTCPHEGATAERGVCEHLAKDDTLDYYQKFTGRGSQYDLVCGECGRLAAEVAVPLRRVCLACFTGLEEGLSVFGCSGILGRPVPLERPTGLAFSHETSVVGLPAEDVIAALQPCGLGSQAEGIALARNGSLFRIDFASGSAEFITRITGSQLDWDKEVSLHVTEDGRLAAIANTYEQHGVVVDLVTGRVTMALQRDDYCIHVSRFPISFVSEGGRTLLVHGTAWNRLDVSDPRTGELLTERGPTSYDRGEERPPHYLDYFHSGLLASPNYEWIADNGWVWHPVGGVRTWNLKEWLGRNVWEAEDGASVRTLCWRSYLWDKPLCWLDDQTLAVWGFGSDDDFMLPAIRIFDAATGKESHWFAGPEGELTFDAFLFASGSEQGTSVWDVKTGERLCLAPDFTPSCYHRSSKTFITLLPGGPFRLSRLEGTGERT